MYTFSRRDPPTLSEAKVMWSERPFKEKEIFVAMKPLGIVSSYFNEGTWEL